MESHKLWGGRFSQKTNSSLEQLNTSINVDQRLWAEDIEGSKAYAQALNQVNLLNAKECEEISNGLDRVAEEWTQGSFKLKEGDEDIHTANERRLKELIGEPASKLHVGRSRNDQVAVDMKLWLRKNLNTIKIKIQTLIQTMVERAVQEIDVIMPGYTHLQRAQPVRWSHYILSHAWNLKYDCERLQDNLKYVNKMPLGSGALAGNPFPINRTNLAKSLNFAEVTENSMQAVSDRNFVAEFLFWASMLGIHLSRLAEDMIIYSTKEFDFISLHETFSTGSSLMPQKRNPDSLELVRGIGGSLFGECCSFVMVLKSLPSTYNKDLQSDKELMFKVYDKLHLILDVTTGVIETLKLNSDKCRTGLSYDMLATDVAYYLVRKGVPFREAHHISGEVVAKAEKQGVGINELNVEDLQRISACFDEDVQNIWNFEHSIEQYQTSGGTSKNSVSEQIEHLNDWLKNPKTSS